MTRLQNLDDPLSFIIDLISNRKESYGKVVIKAVLVRENNKKLLYNTRISLLNLSESCDKELTHDYGKFIFLIRIISLNELIQFLNSIVSGIVSIGEISGIHVDGVFSKDAWFSPSRTHDFEFLTNWPTTLVRFNVNTTNHVLNFQDSIVKLGLPSYPSLNEGVKSFLNYDIERNDNTLYNIILPIPDYRARIKTMEIEEKKITLLIESDTQNLSNLVVKLFGKNKKTSESSLDLISDKNGNVQYEFQFIPSEIHVHLLDKIDGDVIDFKEYGTYYETRHEGISVKTSADTILSFIDGCESQTVEFKESLGKDEFLETIVAFANSNDGVIILGVSDRGEILGLSQDAITISQRIKNLINGRCEPDIPVNIEIKEIHDKIVVVVSVKKGKDPPYLMKSKGAFIRKDSHDLQMNRYELDNVYSKKSNNNGFSTFSM